MVGKFQGCRVRDHIVTVSDLPTEGDKPPQNRVYEDLLSHRDVICVPYQRLSDARYTLGVCWTVCKDCLKVFFLSNQNLYSPVLFTDFV